MSLNLRWISHWRRKHFFKGGGSREFSKIFPRGPYVVKFEFYSSKRRKQPFLLDILKSKGGKIPPPPFQRPWVQHQIRAPWCVKNRTKHDSQNKPKWFILNSIKLFPKSLKNPKSTKYLQKGSFFLRCFRDLYPQNWRKSGPCNQKSRLRTGQSVIAWLESMTRLEPRLLVTRTRLESCWAKWWLGSTRVTFLTESLDSSHNQWL